MRSILVLTCCLALASLARGADQDNDNQKRRHAEEKQQQQPQQQQVIKPAKHTGDNAGQFRRQQGNLPGLQPNNATTIDAARLKKHHNLDNQGNLPGVQSNDAAANAAQFRKHQKLENQGNLPGAQTNARVGRLKHFDLPRNTTQVESVKFRENAHIEGSEKWEGKHYAAFQNYKAEWHDKDWWREHHRRILLIGGGWYFWDNGFWYPAWGYDTVHVYYPYDGPIYAYNDLPPDQVIANVQAALQEQGYYDGEVDGMLGPLTRAALARYQAAHGLYPTSAIDAPTMESLGFA